MTKKRIIIIDDEPMILSLMKELVNDEEDVEVALATGSKEEFLQSVSNQAFDIALVDISVGGREDGFEILQTLKTNNINIPCIILSAHDEIDYALRCLKAGARGYVNKRYICASLIDGVKEVLSGKYFISGENSAYLLNQFENK
jgi:DNA-binding NarL/FixJ family response regulator